MGRYLFNSLVVATVITVAQVLTSVLSAYAFAFLEFPGRTVLFVVFLATLLVPVEATLVVNRRTIDSLGWLNSYPGLTVPFLATAFGTFLLRQVFLTLPRDLRDAASIDGVGHVGFLRHVAVPLVRPTIGAMALLSFLSASMASTCGPTSSRPSPTCTRCRAACDSCPNPTSTSPTS